MRIFRACRGSYNDVFAGAVVSSLDPAAAGVSPAITLPKGNEIGLVGLFRFLEPFFSGTSSMNGKEAGQHSLKSARCGVSGGFLAALAEEAVSVVPSSPQLRHDGAPMSLRNMTSGRRQAELCQLIILTLRRVE